MKRHGLRIGATLGLIGLTALGAVLAIGAATSSAVIIASVAAMAVGSLIKPGISGGPAPSGALAVVTAIPFILVAQVSVVTTRIDFAAVVASYALGSVTIGLLRTVLTGRFVRSAGSSFRLFVGSVVFVLSFSFARFLFGDALQATGWELLIPAAVAGLIWFATDLAIWSTLVAVDRRQSNRYLVKLGMTGANVWVTLFATGALFGLMYPLIGWWSILMSGLPYLLAHSAFRRYHETRRTYKQTIRALARIPEVSGLGIEGHCDRTALLAVDVARLMDVSPRMTEEVEFTALMHDIGRITLADSAVLDSQWTEEDLARWGSEIIGGSPVLERIAENVRRQYQPLAGDEVDSTPVAARIVRVVSAFDNMTEGRSVPESEAVERLKGQTDVLYDSAVVEALVAVLEARREAIEPISV